jgi:hypothetical protein
VTKNVTFNGIETFASVTNDTTLIGSSTNVSFTNFPTLALSSTQLYNVSQPTFNFALEKLVQVNGTGQELEGSEFIFPHTAGAYSLSQQTDGNVQMVKIGIEIVNGAMVEVVLIMCQSACNVIFGSHNVELNGGVLKTGVIISNWPSQGFAADAAGLLLQCRLSSELALSFQANSATTDSSTFSFKVPSGATNLELELVNRVWVDSSTWVTIEQTLQTDTANGGDVLLLVQLPIFKQAVEYDPMFQVLVDFGDGGDGVPVVAIVVPVVVVPLVLLLLAVIAGVAFLIRKWKNRQRWLRQKAQLANHVHLTDL